jgi:hypothetical protein
VLDDLRRVTRQLIENVADDVGASIFVRTQSTPLEAEVAEHDANVVIVGRDDPALAGALLEKRPRTRMLAVVDDGEQSLLYELQPKRRELGELSREVLATELRHSGEPRSTWMP